MSRKWLYGVALGSLLVAGNAVGITVQDVLNHDFFAPEHRGTYEYVEDGTETYHFKEKNPKQSRICTPICLSKEASGFLPKK